MGLELYEGIPVLKFGTFTFFPGLNLTVRKSGKWEEVQPGCPVWLTSVDGLTRKYGRILATETVSLDYVNPIVYNFEHDPNCRSRESLKVELDKVYPDGWGPKVTLVWFWPLNMM